MMFKEEDFETGEPDINDMDQKRKLLSFKAGTFLNKEIHDLHLKSEKINEEVPKTKIGLKLELLRLEHINQNIMIQKDNNIVKLMKEGRKNLIQKIKSDFSHLVSIIGQDDAIRYFDTIKTDVNKYMQKLLKIKD